MKKYLKIGLAVSAAFLAALIIGFVVWAGDAALADDAALQALVTDETVIVREENDWLIFTPVSEKPSTGFVFYPGGKVDFRAYAPALRMVASEGFFVVIVPAPLNLAFFDVNAAARVQAAYPEIKDWFVGGHSLGGVAASSYVAKAKVKGVVFWASYPANDVLKVNNIPAVSIYGTRDGLATSAQLDSSKALLLPDTQFIPIVGGNHAQFGSYGLQDGDNEAEISAYEQWHQAATATVAFFEGVLK